MVRVLLFILFNCLLVSQGNAADTTITIAAFGDSLFAGYGLPPEAAFPAQLEQRLKTDGYHVTVFNDGLSGDTSAGGVSRLDVVLSQKPDIVLLELGSNDLLRGVQPAEITKNLDTILSRLYQARIRVLLLGQKAPPTLGLAYASAYDAMYPALASRYGIGLYPFVLDGVYGRPDLLQPDGVHPTAEGVAVMVNNTYPMITALLQK